MPPKPSRRPRKTGTVHQRANGTWTAQLDVGYVDGKRRRVTVYAPTRPEILKKIGALQRQLDEHGDIPTSDMTVEKWLTYWLDNIAAKRLKPNTYRSYRTCVREHLIPSLGSRRLGRLAAQHIRSMHDDLLRRGLTSTTALNAHRVLSVALNDAVRDGKVARNVAALVTAPPRETSTRTGLTAAEAMKALKIAGPDRLGSRWLAAFSLGLRQGERLGLRWSYLDLVNGSADLSWSLQRVNYRHGCTDPCERRPASCPARVLAIPRGMEHEVLVGNFVLMRPKTLRSRRVVALIEPLRLALLARQAAVEAERGAYTTDHDLVWCTPTGAPIDPRQDWQDWCDLLEAAKVKRVTQHETRHTTATLLLEAKVDPKVIKEILGHSDIVTSQGYQHVSLALQREALDRVSERLELD